MHNMNRSYGVTAVLASFMLSTSMASPTAYARDDVEFSLAIDVPKARLMPYMPLEVGVTLSNEGEEAVETTVGLGRLNGNTFIRFARKDGEYRPWLQTWLPMGMLAPLEAEIIEPGDKRAYAWEIFAQPDMPIGAEPGTYLIRAFWRGSVGEIQSVPVEAVFQTPSEESDAECLDALSRKGLVHFLSLRSPEILRNHRQHQRDPADIAEALLEIAQNHAESDYAAYCLGSAILIAHCYSEPDGPLVARIHQAVPAYLEKYNSARVRYAWAVTLLTSDPKAASRQLDKAVELDPGPMMHQRIAWMRERLNPEVRNVQWGDAFLFRGVREPAPEQEMVIDKDDREAVAKVIHEFARCLENRNFKELEDLVAAEVNGRSRRDFVSAIEAELRDEVPPGKLAVHYEVIKLARRSKEVVSAMVSADVSADEVRVLEDRNQQLQLIRIDDQWRIFEIR